MSDAPVPLAPAVPPTPPIPLSALLAREDLALRRIAGPTGPDISIHWAHTSEMADPYPYLLGGELLLTAGVHVTPADATGAYFDTYVSRVAAAGGAAIGFGLAPVHDTVPPTLVAACEAHGLPLLEVPPQTTFSGVARAVWQLMAQARLAELRRVTEAQQRLAAAASRPDPVPSVLRQLAQRLNGWGVLYGPDGTEIASAGRAPHEAARQALAHLTDVVRPAPTTMAPAPAAEGASVRTSPPCPTTSPGTSGRTHPPTGRTASPSATTSPGTTGRTASPSPTTPPGTTARTASSSPANLPGTIGRTASSSPTTQPGTAARTHPPSPPATPSTTGRTAPPSSTSPPGTTGWAASPSPPAPVGRTHPPSSPAPVGRPTAAAVPAAARPTAAPFPVASRTVPSSATDTVAGSHLAAYALGTGQGFVLGVASPRREPGDHTIASVAAVLLSLLTGEHRSGTGAARSSALVRVLLGAPPEEVAPLLGTGRWVVVHARPDTQAADAVAASALGAALGSALVDLTDGVVRVLLPAEREPGPQPGWALGVSTAVGPGDWATADAQAARALARARATRTALVGHGTRPGLTDLLPRDEADAHAQALLAPLGAAPALTETLHTWLSLHGSWDRTAVALSVHRNTVRQRIARCAVLLGTDLDDPDVRMELWFALRRA
ncbi:PucR family transcriptional regulator ligand-binding domain-containing protein [Streptomyces sp. NPDC088817]|uniref:PucR family transcriptional regulator ligand-binding domain-containing protein n=1 Tax=unclassified Streptomyces TaxID=2593676 RepID=UPI0036E08444